MAVTNTHAFDGPFYPNGVVTSFPYTFRAMAAHEVSLMSESGDLIGGFDFTVLLDADNDGGTVSFASAPHPAALPAFLIVSVPAFGVAADLGSTTAFNPRSLNPSFDRLAVQGIFLNAQAERSIQAPIGETGGTLPPLSERAGLVAVFTADGGMTGVESFSFIGGDSVDDGLWSQSDIPLDDGTWG